MRPNFNTFYSRLPGGGRFNDLVKCVSVYLKYPKVFPPSAFRCSVRHFFLGGGYGIVVPLKDAEIPTALYHITSEDNLNSILESGIVSPCEIVFLADCIQGITDHLAWEQIPFENWNKLVLLTVDSKLCRELAADIFKITRKNEFIAQSVPPEAIVSCEIFQEQLASDHHGN